ncbi:MAG: DNA repair protein RecO [Tenericutes bacterium GWC2_34_14]|nr:MAG: DNA repair protein RecO [Tenericutes bacterium GWA2_35_7]OHE28400.1 MAG: DNA repair protein RecO [Tenericutes bacterium GWC2_34_14]OHE33692.1 MAG: DNA repair protein RecO [Tenericutes bacterium GWE2_34_108]OHE36977.1 MAG: DNA repair protein RecO [Tenericutes bacterium GWF1_35_14]OHE37943.1 MAG: DNA repair protein RecO [Tenericutes bacterium GWF2_35_184]OHE41120.1 MAG: DNA repair protein RecO [Tenericutes bacterium RIFOXYA12_FULL_35_10]OHE43540.1 MAG: DNA repair protein RecO [Tenericut
MEGMIYKVQPYQEHGRLCFTYTEKGKVTLYAQGAQKVNHANRILAQFLTKISFKEGTKSFLPLQEAAIINDYQHLKLDYKKTQAAALMLEIIDKVVVENANHGLIYHELCLALDAKSVEVSSLSFAIKMMQELGYGLSLKPDGRKVKGVSISKGVLIYQDEDEPIDLETKDAVTLLKLSVMPYDQLDLEILDLNQIKEYTSKYYSYHLQTTLKNLQ